MQKTYRILQKITTPKGLLFSQSVSRVLFKTAIYLALLLPIRSVAIFERLGKSNHKSTISIFQINLYRTTATAKDDYCQCRGRIRMVQDCSFVSCTERSLQHPLVTKWVRGLLPHISTLTNQNLHIKPTMGVQIYQGWRFISVALFLKFPWLSVRKRPTLDGARTFLTENNLINVLLCHLLLTF